MPFDSSNGTAPIVTPFVIERFFDGVATGTGLDQGRSGEMGRRMS